MDPINLLQEAANQSPHTTAVIDMDSGQQYTYSELLNVVKKRAVGLKNAGINAGDQVGLLISRKLEFFLTVHAVWFRNATAVPMHLKLTQHELSRQTNLLDLNCLLCDSETENLAVNASSSAVYSLDEPKISAVTPLEESELININPVVPDSEDPWLIMFTSGTTSHPKAVVLTYKNLVCSARATRQFPGSNPGNLWLDPLPLYHMGGMAPIIRACLNQTTLLLSPFTFDTLSQALNSFPPTGISIVPTMLNDWFRQGFDAPDELEIILLGGASIPADLVQQCKQRDLPIYPTYGMTETGSQIATATPDEAYEYGGQVARPLDTVDITIVNSSNRELSIGNEGEIVVDGPMVMDRYYNNPEANNHAFSSHGFHTGDIGHLSQSGLLWVKGRRADRIVTGGENVEPDEVKQVLESHDRIREASVVGLEHPRWGQQVAALIVPNDNQPLNPEEIKSYCCNQLAGYKCPRLIEFVDELPRTSSGTVDRDLVRRDITSR
ncbi:MAG: class I adenylate-forming enzyme family protein [bacterium]